jgi:prepilin-type N-terminal cleavage/methylation domain-containing protein/prepilin-type processing-associated H-X9-DG protein
MRKQAFTLMELLVVIAIIGIVIVLLLPALARTQETGRSTVCLNNLHQIGIGLQLYVQDNQNRLPVMYDLPTNGVASTHAVINKVLLPYLGISNVFRCPSDNQHLFETTGSSYAWNVLLNGQDADRIEILTNSYPAHQVFVVFDKEKFHILRGNQRAINFLYADGHIKNLMEMQSMP